MTLSDLLRIAAGAEPREAHALELAEQQERSIAGRTGLVWLTRDGSSDVVRRAVDLLANRIAAGTGDSTYREAKHALSRAAELNTDHVADAATTVLMRERQAAYYLGLTRGWHAAWRLLRGER